MKKTNKIRYTFNKNEKITLRKDIIKLFKSKNIVKKKPLYAKYITLKAKKNIIKILITVPKKNIKKATDRNKIKRLIRENYRLNKNIIHQNIENTKIHIVITYINHQKTDFYSIKNAIIEIFNTINNNINNNNTYCKKQAQN